MTVPDNETEATVAVIDDYPDIRDALRGLLRSVGLHVESLCCTDQQPGAVSPPQRHLWEANILRPPEFEHAVQRGDGNGHLGHLPAFGP